jgi:hypothetical protein
MRLRRRQPQACRFQKVLTHRLALRPSKRLSRVHPQQLQREITMLTLNTILMR